MTHAGHHFEWNLPLTPEEERKNAIIRTIFVIIIGVLIGMFIRWLIKR